MSSPLFTWRCVLRDRDDIQHPLTPSQFATLSAIALFVDANTLECEVGSRRLAKVSGLYEQTVRRSVRSLAASWLAVEDRSGRPWRLRLLDPVHGARGTEADHPVHETQGAAPDPGHETRPPRARRPRTPGTVPDEDGGSPDGGVGAGAQPNESVQAELAALLEELAATGKCATPAEGPQRRRLLRALAEAPNGFRALVEKAKGGNNPIALLDSFVKRGVHLSEQKQPQKPKLACPQCGIGFGTRSKLDDHLANVHDVPRIAEDA